MPSPFLPPEILDLIVDHLHDERTALEACCLVSRPWVHRARRHLFFRIDFSPASPIESWIKAFPDPSSSPAHYARVLTLHGSPVVATAGTSALAWVRALCHIVELGIFSVVWDDSPFSLIQLHGLFPALKSFSLSRSYIPPPELLDIICSFPLLKDLGVYLRPTLDTTTAWGWSPPSTLPELTGTLRLNGKVRFVVRGLLGLPKFFRFREIALTCFINDADLTMDLVSKCSKTLETLTVGFLPTSTFSSLSALGQYLTATH